MLQESNPKDEQSPLMQLQVPDTMPVLKRESIPAFELWLEDNKHLLSTDSPRGLKQLWEDLFLKQEVALLTSPTGEKVRYGRVSAVNVFYESNGKKYKAAEQRYTLKKGRTFEEVKAGDMSALEPSPSRPAKASLSERIKLSGEDPHTATLRALHEELFDTTLEEEGGDSYPELDNLLQEQLRFSTPIRTVRDAYADGNSYQGIPSVLDEYHASITFTPDMHTPIKVKDGVPQTLPEYDKHKGYVNLFVWELVEETA